MGHLALTAAFVNWEAGTHLLQSETPAADPCAQANCGEGSRPPATVMPSAGTDRQGPCVDTVPRGEGEEAWNLQVATCILSGPLSAAEDSGMKEVLVTVVLGALGGLSVCFTL